MNHNAICLNYFFKNFTQSMICIFIQIIIFLLIERNKKRRYYYYYFLTRKTQNLKFSGCYI